MKNHEKIEKMVTDLTGKTLTEGEAYNLKRLAGAINDEKYELIEKISQLLDADQIDEAKQFIKEIGV